jgi:[ribosomal protein S5]-alanine N-acetyltransferase
MPCLELDRLLLRPFSPNDLDDLLRLWTEPLVRRFLWDDIVISREQAAAVIEASQESFDQFQFGFWRVDLKPDYLPIGFCGLRHFSDAQVGANQVEILYGLSPVFWGKGLALEAAQGVLQFGFEKLKLAQIYAGADPPNVASFRVMERLGMHFDHETEINGLSTRFYVTTREDYFAKQT